MKQAACPSAKFCTLSTTIYFNYRKIAVGYNHGRAQSDPRQIITNVLLIKTQAKSMSSIEGNT